MVCMVVAGGCLCGSGCGWLFLWFVVVGGLCGYECEWLCGYGYGWYSYESVCVVVILL